MSASWFGKFDVDDFTNASRLMIHNDDPIGQEHGLGDIVRHHDHRDRFVLPDAQQFGLHTATGQRIERAKRFIEEQDLWPRGETACDRRSLRHAARKLVGISGFETAQAHQPDEPSRGITPLRFGERCFEQSSPTFPSTEKISASSSSSHRTAYAAAVNGLAANEKCTDEDEHLIREGYLLSMKAFAEHYLSAGDSRTDFNQANVLLVECQTRPGLYGTRAGAGCETQEQYNIRAQTNWEMESNE